MRRNNERFLLERGFEKQHVFAVSDGICFQSRIEGNPCASEGALRRAKVQD